MVLKMFRGIVHIYFYFFIYLYIFINIGAAIERGKYL